MGRKTGLEMGNIRLLKKIWSMESTNLVGVAGEHKDQDDPFFFSMKWNYA